MAGLDIPPPESSGAPLACERARGPRQRAASAGLFLAGLLLVGLYLPVGKPLWIDEFLQFALGAFDSTAQILAIIHESTRSINHGQTGFYMLLDHYLVRVFGASAFALRLPSVLSAIFLIFCALFFLRNKNVGIVGRFALLVALAAQSNLMNYLGEARPYLPLAATVVGTLAYYASPLAMRARPCVVAIGWGSVILGALLHPYFAIYWFAIMGFCVWSAWLTGSGSLEFAEIRRLINPALLIAGLILIFALGSVTWLQRRETSFDFDPFQWVTQGIWTEFTAFSHFTFIPNARIFVAIAVAIPVVYILSPARFKEVLRPFVSPATLLIVALLISIMVSAVSYTQSYWILSRQWVASQALVPIAFIWFASEIIHQVETRSRLLAIALALAGLAYLAVCAWPSVHMKAGQQWAALQAIGQAPPSAPVAIPAEAPSDMADWVRLANENVATGGPAWPVFRKFYGR